MRKGLVTRKRGKKKDVDVTPIDASVCVSVWMFGPGHLKKDALASCLSSCLIFKPQTQEWATQMAVHLKSDNKGLPWWSSGWASKLQTQGAWLWPRSWNYIPHAATKESACHGEDQRPRVLHLTPEQPNKYFFKNEDKKESHHFIQKLLLNSKVYR